ncbi:MAG: Smr/MutS family protein [Treponema sp.]
MNFEDILNQWEAQTQKPYGKKRMREDAKTQKTAHYTKENTKTLNPMEYWLRRYGVYDKDAENTDEMPFVDKIAEKRRLRALRPQAEIDLHGMTLEEAYESLVHFFKDSLVRQYRKVLIIHGKGNHSHGDPVLARFVQKFLEDHPNAGETGHPKGREGGTGSTWVILK